MRQIQHFIDGAAVTGVSGRFGDVFNPNTGEVQARVQLATDAAFTNVLRDGVVHEAFLNVPVPAKGAQGWWTVPESVEVPR